VGNFNSRHVKNFVPIKMLKKIENRPIFDKVMTLDKRVSNLLGHKNPLLMIKYELSTSCRWCFLN